MDDEKRKIALIGIICATIMEKKRKQQRSVNAKKQQIRRSLWTQKWLLQRENSASMIMNQLQLEDPQSFYNFTRMQTETFKELLQKVSPLIKRQNTIMREAICPTARLLVTLRFLASGATYRDLSNQFRISVPTISSMVPRTLDAICAVLKDEFFKAPQSANEWKEIAKEFEQKWNFPHCLGALDGMHVAIRSRKDYYGPAFYNYKGFHSIILLAVIDANYKFIYIVGAKGGANCAATFNDSSFWKRNDFPEDTTLPGSNMEVPYVLIADDALQMTPRMLKRYEECTSERNTNFNYRLGRAHRVAENAFGLLASKFHIFHRDIDLPVEKVELVSLAACALHNFIATREGIPTDVLDCENTDEYSFARGTWRQNVFFTRLQRSQTNSSNEQDTASHVRDLYGDYFNTTAGSVPWQIDAMIKNEIL